MDDPLIEEIRSIPALPESIIKIQEVINDPDSGIRDLAQAVEDDPALMANILKAANSSFYGFSREITSIEQAVALFGMATVHGMALAASVRGPIKLDLEPYGMNAESYAHAAQKRAQLVNAWFGSINRELANLLIPTVVLSDLGMVVISLALKRSNQVEAFQNQIQAGQERSHVENLMFGRTNEQVCAQLIEHWGLSPKMVDLLSNSGDLLRAQSEYKLGVYALCAVRMAIDSEGQMTEEQLESASALVKDVHLNPASFEESCKALFE